MASVTFGRVRADVFTFEEGVRAASSLVQGTVFTPNVDHVVRAGRDERFAAAYASATLSFADGMPLVLLSKLTSTPLPAKLSGSDLMLPIMRAMGERGRRVLLVGPSAKVAKQARRQLEADCLGLTVPAITTLVFEPREADARHIAEFAAKHDCDVILFSLGAPKQELLAQMVSQRSPVVCLCFGASLDFYVGNVKRAPKWMQRCALEWLYRCATEPRRLIKRYFQAAFFFPIALLHGSLMKREG